ncbi:hypothetical protein CONPUDRAFT_168122 [Coniophora puteana RWD-64-598 SS2]|uniref:J domain-containing protein n=1 Tax=Coniophora puteana (strain RWD-64-598) TaxID=741705 RepID=A0A5M3MCZ4_CONPW|nr:uncharacterized protein CONPUDRAFT_168122 [Coniophora puteana RWD-64-598 SS2]EIW77109.1 hypothetical protein CONPUDRAFT_168122 [Coniophora puteana RWD-64-598 SS2]
MLAQHPTEPDGAWKEKLRREIEKNLGSMVEAAKQNRQAKLSAGQVSPDQRGSLDREYKATMETIRRLAEGQFRDAVERERVERKWASGDAIDGNWSDALVKEQQAILDNIEKEKTQSGGGVQRSISGQSTQTNRSTPDSATGLTSSFASQIKAVGITGSPTASTSQPSSTARIWTPKESPGTEFGSYFPRSPIAQEPEESKTNIRSGKKRAGSLTSIVSSSRPPSIPEQPELGTRSRPPPNNITGESSYPPRSSLESPASVRGNSMRRMVGGNVRPNLPAFWTPTITPEEDAAQSKAYVIAGSSSNESASSSVRPPPALRPPSRSTDPPAPGTTNTHAERGRERGSRQSSDTFGEPSSHSDRYASRDYATATPSPTSAVSSVYTHTADGSRAFPPPSASRPIVKRKTSAAADGRVQSSPNSNNWIHSGRYEASSSPSTFDSGPRSWHSSGLPEQISRPDLRQAGTKSRQDRRAVKHSDDSDEDPDEGSKVWRSRRYGDRPLPNGYAPPLQRRPEGSIRDSRTLDEEDHVKREAEWKNRDDEERIRHEEKWKKQDEEDRLRREEERNRLDREELARRREDRRKWDEAEAARREKESRRWDAEIGQRDTERTKREGELQKYEEERKAFEEERHGMAEERQRVEEEDRRRREERKKFQDEEKLRKQEVKKHEEERDKYEAEKRRHDEEDQRQREDGQTKQDEIDRLKGEAKRKEEEMSRLKDLVRRKEQEVMLREEQTKEREAAAERKEEEARELEKKARWREEEALKRNDEARQREEVAVRMETEAKEKTKEAQAKEEEAHRTGDETRRLAADLRRREEDVRKKEQQLQKREENLAQKKAEFFQKELDMQLRDEERGKWDKQQGEYQRRAEEAVRRREERKRQDSWENGRSYPSQGGSSSQPSSNPWPMSDHAEDYTSTTTPDGASFAKASYTPRTGSAWSYASGHTTSTATNQTSTSASATPGTKPSASRPKPATSSSYTTLLSEAEWRRRQAEQAQQQEARFRQEQVRLEQERLSKESRALSRMDIIRLFDSHQSQWDKLHSRATLSWDDFPWPMFRCPIGPDDLTVAGISAYMLSPLQPTDKTVKERIREGIRKWHPDRFETQVLWKVKEEDKERVKEGAGSVVRCLNDLLRSSTKVLFS